MIFWDLLSCYSRFVIDATHGKNEYIDNSGLAYLHTKTGLNSRVLSKGNKIHYNGPDFLAGKGDFLESLLAASK